MNLLSLLCSLAFMSWSAISFMEYDQLKSPKSPTTFILHKLNPMKYFDVLGKDFSCTIDGEPKKPTLFKVKKKIFTTKLHTALSKQDYQVAIELLENGFDVSKKNSDKQSSWDLFVSQYNKQRNPDHATNQSSDTQIAKAKLTRLMIKCGKEPA